MTTEILEDRRSSKHDLGRLKILVICWTVWCTSRETDVPKKGEKERMSQVPTGGVRGYRYLDTGE